MGARFEELDSRASPIGEISLRRRRAPASDVDVYEIKLGDEYLMSSLFTASEIALARRGMAAVAAGASPPPGGVDLVVGGLGLGYTAAAALEDDTLRSMVVVELLGAVIDWHASGLLPLGPGLTADPRCRLVQGDFFALADSAGGLDAAAPGRLFHAILVDIDHSPDALLDDRSAGFYRPEGLRRMAGHLHPGGVFGLWSNERPDAAFTARLAAVFADAWAEPVVFANPLQDQPFTQTIYLARTASA